MIDAKSWVRAQYALDLILSSIILYSGNPLQYGMDLIAYNDEEPQHLDLSLREVILDRSMCMTGIPVSCAIAAKASHRLKSVNALTKYKFSASLYGVSHIDLDPLRARHLTVSPFPSDYVMFSYAIVSAYSALEDLGLEMKASQDKPSRIKGKWNPKVKGDLEARLKASGINLNEPLLWTSRGPERKIEKKREITDFQNVPWTGGPIRDKEIELIDAIAYSAWLRDRVAAHGINELTKVISPYDVVNVQHLTRRVLLEALGFWRH